MKNLLVGAALCAMLAGCSAPPPATNSASPKPPVKSASPSTSGSPATTPSPMTSVTPGASVSPGASATPVEWKTYTAADDLFTVKMPGDFKEEKGAKTTLVATPDKDHAYIVTREEVKDLPPTFTPEFVKKVVESIEKDGSKVTQQVPAEWAGHSALHLEVAGKDKSTIQMGSYIVGTQLVQLIVVRAAGVAAPPSGNDEDKFFESLAFGKTPAGAKADEKAKGDDKAKDADKPKDGEKEDKGE